MIPITEEEMLSLTIEECRNLTPAGKWEVTMEFMEFGFDRIRASVEKEHPDWNREQVNSGMRRKLYPKELCDEVDAYLERRKSGFDSKHD